MKTLNREDIDKVRPKFRKMVREAWERGEEVPFGVVYLSDQPLTETDISWARMLIKQRKLSDETIL